MYPEVDMAIKLARSLVSRNLLEQISLSPEYGIVELLAPRAFNNKSLIEIGLRKRMRVTILAIKRGSDIIVVPGPEEKLYDGDILVALGSNEDLAKLSDWE